MLINRRQLIQFYDMITETSRGHANAISTVAGEDLGAGLLKHCLEKGDGVCVNLLPGTPTQGTRTGGRLDRWLSVKRPSGECLLQAEVKNCCAHSLGGRSLHPDCSEEEMRVFRLAQWQIIRDKWLPLPEVKKVLTPM